MQKITDKLGNDLNCTQIKIYSTASISYVVAETANGSYLFRTFDHQDMLIEHIGQVYQAWDDNGNRLYLVFLQYSDEFDFLDMQAKAHKRTVDEMLRISKPFDQSLKPAWPEYS